MALEKFIAAMLLLLPTAASAREPLCGSATLTIADTEVFVTAQQQIRATGDHYLHNHQGVQRG
jgi:hypothetical protein